MSTSLLKESRRKKGKSLSIGVAQTVGFPLFLNNKLPSIAGRSFVPDEYMQDSKKRMRKEKYVHCAYMKVFPLLISIWVSFKKNHTWGSS